MSRREGPWCPGRAPAYDVIERNDGRDDEATRAWVNDEATERSGA